MSVRRCHICEGDPRARRLYGQHGLTGGDLCPICYRPTCAFHLTTVRWRWRSNGKVDSTRICQECKRHYAHRQWDASSRDWIT